METFGARKKEGKVAWMSILEKIIIIIIIRKEMEMEKKEMEKKKEGRF